MGSRRGKFLLESVLDLKRNLRSVKSDLLISVGYTEDIITKYLSPKGNTVMAQEEITSEETLVEDAVQNALRGRGEIETHWGLTLFHIDDLPFEGNLRDFPNTTPPFLDRVVQKLYPDLAINIRSLHADPRPGSLPLPTDPKILEACQFTPTYYDLPFVPQIKDQPIPKLHPLAVQDFKGGETEGLERLRKYVWEPGCLDEYYNKREDLASENPSSRLSPWIATGCLSPRRIWREVTMFETRRKTNRSTTTMKYTLAYRDWTKFIALKYGSRIFKATGVIGNIHQSRFKWLRSATNIEKWKEGKTGVPFVDAVMRELKETGYIPNRGRLIASNFFTTELWLDWRLGAAHFESCLIDYDVASNWVNWLITANLLNETNLRLHVVPRAMEFDPDGAYTKKWVPEVKNLPSKWIHRPWKLADDILAQYGVVLGKTYPRPIDALYRH